MRSLAATALSFSRRCSSAQHFSSAPRSAFGDYAKCLPTCAIAASGEARRATGRGRNFPPIVAISKGRTNRRAPGPQRNSSMPAKSMCAFATTSRPYQCRLGFIKPQS